MILRRRNTTLDEKAVPVTFLNKSPACTGLIYKNGLVSQLLHTRIQCWIVGNIITVIVLLCSQKHTAVKFPVPTSGRGPAVCKEAPRPTVLHVFLSFSVVVSF
jgi:hypothetical protein